MHDKPGGLCTSWKRKGFKIDGCIHWLVGSSPEGRLGGKQGWEVKKSGGKKAEGEKP